MLKIRLQRIGKKNAPTYRIVVAEHTSGPKSGKYVEKVGTYNPKTKERSINKERALYWLSVGAQASGTVHNMLVSENIIKADKINVLPKKTPIVKEAPEEEKEEKKDEEVSEETTEEQNTDDTPAEEVKEETEEKEK